MTRTMENDRNAIDELMNRDANCRGYLSLSIADNDAHHDQIRQTRVTSLYASLLPVPLSFLSLPSLLFSPVDSSQSHGLADRETEGTAMSATRESPCDDSLSMTEPIRTGFATS